MSQWGKSDTMGCIMKQLLEHTVKIELTSNSLRVQNEPPQDQTTSIKINPLCQMFKKKKQQNIAADICAS